MSVTQIAPGVSRKANTEALGMLVWFAFGGPVDYIDGKRTVLPLTVSTDDLHRWFQEFGLDEGLLPPQVRRIDKFRTATSSARYRYDITGGRADLFVEEAAASPDMVVRNVMRRMTDLNRVTLSIEHVATLQFIRGGRSAKARRTTGDHWKYTILSRVKEPDRTEIEKFIAGIDAAYRDGAEALDTTALRGIIRRYLLVLNAVQLHSSGGIYFVPAVSADTVPALAEVVARIGAPSCSLDYIPFAGDEHHRTIVDKAFQTEVVLDCANLMRAIDAQLQASRGRVSPQQRVADLFTRYDAIKARAEVYLEALELPVCPATEAMEDVAAKLVELKRLTLRK